MPKIEETTDTEALLDSLEAQETLIRKLALKVELAKERLKEAKEELDDAIGRLRQLAGSRLDTPLLDGQEE